jgi:hypothetical protein
MPAVSPENLRIALVVAVAVLSILVLRQAFSTWIRRRRIVGRLVKARLGESWARDLLEARGYCVVGSQFACSYAVRIDDEDLSIPLRADYLVTRDGFRYVAEVKTGVSAPSLRTGATRRQLLEYRIAFDVDGVLLVDAEQKRVHLVEFPFPDRPFAEGLSPRGRAQQTARLAWMVVLAGVAAFIATQWR